MRSWSKTQRLNELDKPKKPLSLARYARGAEVAEKDS